MKSLICLFLFISSLSYAQISHRLELRDIFNLEHISDPQISPDGDKIIYVRNFKDIMTDQNHSNLWIIHFDGTQNRPLTQGSHNDYYPRWSHDGSRIIFKSNRDGSSRLYLMWLDTEKTTALTQPPVSPSSVSWSKDDSMLAFSMFVPSASSSPITLPAKPEGAKWNTPPTYIDDLNYRSDGSGYLKEGYQQLFTLPSSGGTPRQLTDGPFDHGNPIWGPNGNVLFFSANLDENADFDPVNSEIYRLTLSNLEIEALTSRKGPDSSPVLSPDGSTLAYLGFEDQLLGYQQSGISLMDLEGSNNKELTSDFDRSVSDIQWSADGKGIYFQYTEYGHGKLAYCDLNGKIETIIEDMGGLSLGRPYNAAAFTVAKGKYAYTLGTPEYPADLAVGDKGKSRRVTNLNQDLFGHKKLGKTEEIRFRSSYDDREMQGWVITPPNYDPKKSYPFILEIHGGPFASYGAVFSAELQLFAAAGYVVLYMNPRGSTGYGAEFGNLIHHNYPSQDYDDLMSGVDAAMEKYSIDEKNLFVTGGSGGGVLTAWIVGKTDRFKAAVVAKPVINWYSHVLYADAPAFFSKYWFGSLPWEDPEGYMKRSPISLVGNVTTPTMLLTGEEDYRTPIAESEQYYAALQLQKVETAMVRIPGASHGIAARPSNLVGKVAAILHWFEKYRIE